jgi:hypothetical protein
MKQSNYLLTQNDALLHSSISNIKLILATVKPGTMSGINLAQALQLLKGVNFLADNISEVRHDCHCKGN